MSEPDRPNILVWNLTFACPLRCTHCYTESGRRPSETLGHADMLRVADALIKLNPFAISLVGGEPMMLKNIVEIVTRFADAGIKVIIYTGGWSVPVQLVRDLAEVVHKVTVSIDGATAEVHDRIRGRAGAFDHAMITLGRFNDEATRRAEAGLEPLRFGIDYVVTRSNFSQVEEMCAQVATRFPYLDSVAFGAVIPIGLASRVSYAEHELITDEQTEELVSEEMRAKLRRAVPESVTVDTFDNNNTMMHPDYIAANPDLRPLEVEPNGEVRAMAIYEGTVGSLLEEDPFVLWQRARAQWDDPFGVDCLKNVRTRAEWAEAVRRIDHRFGTAEDRVRFDKRPVFLPITG